MLVAVTSACDEARPPEPALVPPPEPATAAPEKKRAEPPALDVGAAYRDVDRIGAKARIHFARAADIEAHTPPEAFRLRFEDRGGFAGICWKNQKGNEGRAPGDDLSGKGYRRISFWARGAAGGEVVEFRAGGLGNHKTRYRDSFDVTAGKIKITNQWKEHVIFVSDEDLSSVMTPFCAMFHREDNPSGAELYLDDIQYRG